MNSLNRFLISRIPLVLIVAVTAGIVALASGCSRPAAPSPAEERASFERRHGVTIVGLHVTARGHLLDLRYRIDDPAKASSFLDRTSKPHLEHEPTGAMLGVPSVPKIGSLRQAPGTAAEAGRTYFILFHNPGRIVAAGEHVDLVVGDERVRGLLVQG